MSILNNPITEEWLKSVGFKWHQLDRRPEKQWLLWLGDALPEHMQHAIDAGLVK